MIKCLLCSRNIAQNFLFSELFLLKSPQNLLCSKCQKNFEKIPEAHCPCCCKPNVHEICTDCQNWEKTQKKKKTGHRRTRQDKANRKAANQKKVNQKLVNQSRGNDK